MIKKLRRRIIFINLLLVGIVILSIVAAINISSYTNSLRNLEHGMSVLLGKENGENGGNQQRKHGQDGEDSDFPDDMPPLEDQKQRFGKQGMDGDEPMQVNAYIIVTLDSDGNITDKQENNVTMDEDDLRECIKRASGDAGQIFDYSLMYIRREIMGETKIVFASNSSVFSSLQSSLFISLLLFIGSLAVIFVISLFLSGLAVKPVKKAWEQQKQFVADASHELKTPLTVILANNNIMLSHEDSTVKEERQWLESTQEEADHMKQLIDEMLYLAKSDAGETNVQYSEVNLSEIVEGCALNFEPVAFEKEVTIDAQIDPNITLDGNATQLNQLAHILTDNAVKYAENGSVVTMKLTKANGRVQFAVNNRGSVIAKDDLAHIFDRFYRAEKSRTTKGYGLGLSIAQRIVQEHKGKLTVVSNEDDGTTFTAEF